MKNKLVNFFEFIGLNYKKEITKISCSNLFLLLMGTILFIFLHNVLIFLTFFILIIVLDFYFYNTYSKKKSLMLSDRDDEFISVISYFQIYISNNKNVYQSFQSIIPFTSPWMKDRLNDFLKAVDGDKSVKPFIDFGNNFVSKTANNVMLSIYQMVDQGNSNEQIMQFVILFDQLQKSHQKALIDKKERSLDTMSSYPLVGAGLMVIVLMFSILSILEDLLNVF